MIYAIKGDRDGFDVLSSLKQGEGRFGWSYCSTANLYELKAKIDRKGWDDGLFDDEKDCYQEFLLEIKPGDYVVYINVPDYGQCVAAKVTGKYTWRFEDQDFNHRFPVDPNSLRQFDRNDAAIHPALSARLKLRGRYWRIYAVDEFMASYAALQKGEAKPKTPETNWGFLAKEMRPHLAEITRRVQHTPEHGS